MNKTRSLWLALTALTLLSFILTDSSSMFLVTAVILAMTAFKGVLIVDGFMELSGVNHIVRKGMLLYCPVVGGLILYVLTR